MENPFQGPL